MMKKYIVARKQLLAERDATPQSEVMTRYATNANYIYEPLQKDSVSIRRLKDDGLF